MPDRYWICEDTNLTSEKKTLINDFLLGLKLENLAPGTIYNYKKLLEKFCLDNSQPLEELNHDQVWDWVKTRYQGISDGGRNNILAQLSKFFKFCLEEGYMEKVLVKRYWFSKPSKSSPKFLTAKQLAQVRLAAEKLSLRDQAIIEFYLTSGCRLSEVIGLNLKDINLKKRTTEVRGKGNKIRKVYFSDYCAILLEKYLATRDDDQEALFISGNGIKKGTRLGVSGIEYMVEKLGRAAGLQKKLTPHFFRHTFATHLLSQGFELNLIATFLGHQDLKTTRIYATILPEKIILMYHQLMG